MEIQSIVGSIILIFTGLVTYNGFIKKEYFDKNLFHVDKILVDKEYHRLMTSGFLHLDWFHFGFNMIGLYSFSVLLESSLGALNFGFVYFASMLGGSLLSLFIHRYHGDYSAAGASGAVSGAIFASIILFPHGQIGIILLPFSIPSWIMGTLFMVISIIGIKTKLGNIGHDAHLGGALTGGLLAIAIRPDLALSNWWVILLLLVPTIIFIIIVVRFPAFLIIDKGWKASMQAIQLNKLKKPKSKNSRKEISKTKRFRNSRPNHVSDNRLSLDDILDKINREGINSLTEREKEALEEWRNKM